MNEIIENENALSNESIEEFEMEVSETDDVSVSDSPIPSDTPTPYVTLGPVLDDSEEDSTETDSKVTVEDEVLDSEIDTAAETVQSSDDILLAVQSLDTSLQRTNYLLSAILFFVIFWWVEEKIYKSVRRLFVNARDH